jgi:UDP-3-O-[3-hydroxymyristoyl] glucosamine N-acyltransferase
MNPNRPESPKPEVLTVGEVADLVGGRVQGDRSIEVHGLAPVDQPGDGQLAFLVSRRYTKHVAACEAPAFLVASDMESALPATATRIVVDEPYPAMRTLLRRFHPDEIWTPDIHETAVIGRDVVLGAEVEIAPYAVIESGVRVGDRARIGAHVVVGRGSVIGDGSRLHPHVVLYPETHLGRDVIVHSGARLGAEGFGYTFIEGEHRKIPQVGRCVVEDDVEIGANTTIDRGSLGDTRIGRGTKLDNLVQIAHNVRIGARTLMAALSGVAGSTRIGEGVWLGGQVGVINNLDVGDGVRVTVRSGVTRDVPAGETISGMPGRPHREDLRRMASVGRIPRLLDRVAELERRVDELSKS